MESSSAKVIEILTNAIPGLDKVSNVAKTKILKAFKERTFMPRVKLIEEGKVSNNAYVLIQGT